MTTGNRTVISDDTDHLWKETGIYHLLSISGLHMTIIAGIIFVFIRTSLLLIPNIALKYNIKKIAAFMAILAAYFYVLISGESVPAMRAFITVSVMLCAVLLDRQVISIRNAIIAYYIILIINPAQLFHIGFCLSFAAVMGITFAAEIISSLRTYKYKTHYEPLSFSEKILPLWVLTSVHPILDYPYHFMHLENWFLFLLQPIFLLCLWSALLLCLS